MKTYAFGSTLDKRQCRQKERVDDKFTNTLIHTRTEREREREREFKKATAQTAASVASFRAEHVPVQWINILFSMPSPVCLMLSISTSTCFTLMSIYYKANSKQTFYLILRRKVLQQIEICDFDCSLYSVRTRTNLRKLWNFRTALSVSTNYSKIPKTLLIFS